MQGLKKYYLLVDGYNIINAWQDLKDAQDISLDNARDLLIDIMAELAKITGERTIIVFDSYLQKNPLRQYISKKGIEIVFTKEFETADNYIESFVSHAGKHDIIKVASSDAIIQSITFGKGASRISAMELKHYYESSKEQTINRLTRNTKKHSKKSKNIVSISKESFALLEEIEKQLKK